MSEGELILYNTEDGAAIIGLRAVDGTVWLSQREIAELFEGLHQQTKVEQMKVEQPVPRLLFARVVQSSGLGTSRSTSEEGN